MSDFDPNDPAGAERLRAIQKLQGLAETLDDRPAGDLFRADLEEARSMAAHDPRFKELAAGLASQTLGGRMAAINAFFDQVPPVELATLTLPPHLSQLRFIYLSSRQ
jgi:hypothetical protein